MIVRLRGGSLLSGVFLLLLPFNTVALALSSKHNNGGTTSQMQNILDDASSIQRTFQPHLPLGAPQGPKDGGEETIPSGLSALLEAIEVMQSHHFELWQGTWPRAIDWTAAVLGTHVSATLRTITSSFDKYSSSPDALALDNIVNRYFLQTSAFYFGENAFSLRNQAYDDMLWVVLGWLENIKLIDLHSRLHYSTSGAVGSKPNMTAWHGEQFVPSAAHRARVFYELASQGWDTELCGGGMTWNPYLTPYKNAITNELYIAASISMYLYFPGDDNPSPFRFTSTSEPVSGELDLEPAKPHDPSYLSAAVEGYKWLKESNMTSNKGLYVDGFHIRGWHRNPGNGTTYPGTGKCDERNEMVYTYNQGVLLTGLRGLWIATGAQSYLQDAHNLIASVIDSTGWREPDGNWKGLGRNGVLEEGCDNSGTCSQNGHTFKGIFFHHLTEFCRPVGPDEAQFLPEGALVVEQKAWHERECAAYQSWVTHNAQAAFMTRNDKGEMGTWWGRKFPSPASSNDPTLAKSQIPQGGVDYRNAGVPENDTTWVFGDNHAPDGDIGPSSPRELHTNAAWEDVNDRGRGRTVETQSGGVAVLRAFWEWQIRNVR